MKTDFDHPPSAEELLAAYQESEKSNPASIYYNRILVRPRPHFGRAIFFLAAMLALAFLIALLVYWLSDLIWLSVVCGVLSVIAVCIVFAKHILIWSVRIYQRFAPAKVRNRCRFEPSCSEYMILSIQKYGVRKGFKKGLKRWKSCKPPHGGFDWP